MNNDIKYYEKIIFEYVSRIKRFEGLIINQYYLKDIPFNVSGKEFPKVGSIKDNEGKDISYRYHGRGCTFFDDNLEISFNVDATSKHQIILTEGGIYCYLKAFLSDFDESFTLEPLIENLEQRGVFMRRKAGDLGSFHVNEEWYLSYVNNVPFSGKNKNDSDWV